MPKKTKLQVPEFPRVNAEKFLTVCYFGSSHFVVSCVGLVLRVFM